MIIDTHTHVVSSDKVKHPLDLGARGWSTEVSNDVEDLIAEMDRAGVACATLVQPNACGSRKPESVEMLDICSGHVHP